jgi:ABC-type multidrug transport system permease subunit
MMPGNVFRLQVAAATGSKRQMLLRIGLTALLALPFVFVGMPPRAQAGGIVMVILFTSFFGAAVGHAHLRDDGRLERLTLLPMRRELLWLDLILASVAARLAPAGAVLGAFLAVNTKIADVRLIIPAVGFLGGCLLLLTLLGTATAKLARNNAEVHLFGALAVGVIAFLSGITPLPDRLAWVAVAARWNPIQHLFASLLSALNASEPTGGRELAIASLMLAALVAALAIRWISGSAKRGEKFDEAGGDVNNGAVSGGRI